MSENPNICSFAITSLFTNVPLTEVIEISAQLLYHEVLLMPPIPEPIFVELMNTTTRGVEFHFNDSMFAHIDSVAMASPFGPIRADIFVDYHKQRAFTNLQSAISVPNIYYR